MKKLLTILLSLMFVVSINALGVSGTYQEVKTKTVVLQTHTNVTVQSVVINTTYDLKVVQQFNFEVLAVDKPLSNLKATDTTVNLESLNKNYFIDVPLVSEPTILNGLLLTTTTNKMKKGRCLFLFYSNENLDLSSATFKSKVNTNRIRAVNLNSTILSYN